MHPVFDLDGEFEQVEFALCFHFDRRDIGVRTTDFGSDAGQDAFFLDDKQAQITVETAVQVFPPIDVDPFVRFACNQFFGLRAFGVMNNETVGHIEFADDGITRNRQTACRQLDIDSFAAVDDDRFDFLRFFFACRNTLFATDFLDQTGDSSGNQHRRNRFPVPISV